MRNLYLIFNFSNKNFKRAFRQILPYILFVSVIWIAAVNYKGGKNVVNELIIERLAVDEESGIAGNNRFHGDVDADFDKYLSDGTLFMGIGYDDYRQALEEGVYSGIGYKVFMLPRGFFGVILTLAFYLLIIRGCENKRFMYGLLLVYIITFLQRSYPFYSCWTLTYILCISNCVYNTQVENKLLSIS